MTPCTCNYVYALGRLRSRPVARLGCARHVPTTLPIPISDRSRATHVRTPTGHMLTLHDGAGTVHARLVWGRAWP